MVYVKTPILSGVGVFEHEQVAGSDIGLLCAKLDATTK